MNRKTVSIIVPAYNEALNLPHLYTQLKTAVGNLPYKFEIIFVDDCSQDNSAVVLKDLSKADKTVKVISFARNFGKEIATTAGLHAAKGDAAIMIDADLQ